MLFIIIRMRGCLKTPSHDDYYNYIPEALTLELTCEELKNTRKNRFQQRKVRSTRAGELALNYQTAVMPDGNRIVAEDLTVLAAPGMTFAYDTIFTVIELRYIELMQRKEIQYRLLKDHGLYISTGSISELSLKGLGYLEQCHFNQSAKLAAYYRKSCFIIHLDGTNEGGMYNHFVVRDGMTGNVLYAEKIVSESEKSIRAILVKVKMLFGVPDAVISDMSPAIIKAVKVELLDIPHRLCHFHFLKAVGVSVLEKHHKPVMISVKRMKDMLAEQRRELKTELKLLLQQGSSEKNRQQSEACQWAINLIDYIRDYEKDMSGEGFPFDLPAIAFYDRCEQAFSNIDKIMLERSRHFGRMGLASSTLCFIRNRIQEFMGYCHINQIRNLNDIFMELRNIIHPKSKTEAIPLNWGMANSDTGVENISEQLKALQIKAARFAKRKHATYQTKAWKAVNSRLIKYNEALNPVIDFRGDKFILPRTNNLSETGFRDCKRQARRITGTKRLSKYMDNLPAQYFYTFNLNDQDYIKTVFGDQEIFDSFHTVDKNVVKSTVAKMKKQRLSPKQINNKLIRSKDFIMQFTNHFMIDKKTKSQPLAMIKKQTSRSMSQKQVA